MLFLVWGTRHGSLSRGGARFRVRDNSWYFCLVFVIAPPPRLVGWGRIHAKYGLFQADWFFLGRSCTRGGACIKNKKNVSCSKNSEDFNKKIEKQIGHG